MKSTGELLEQVDRVRRELNKAKTFDEAMVVLSMVDTPVLREIERDYLMWPVGENVLRERLADAYMTVRNGSQERNTKLVTPEVVKTWALDTLGEWLQGYTDFDESIGGQYRVALVVGGPEGVELFEVTTPQRRHARQFKVDVTVTEVRPGRHRRSLLPGRSAA